MSQERKRRSFMTELLLWILLLVVVPVMAFQVYFYFNSVDQMRKLEQEKAQIFSRSTQNAIENLGESILGITVTNAYWEENRAAVERGDRQWLVDNITDMPDIVPIIDFAVEADLQGNVMVQAGDIKELTGRIRYPVILKRFANEHKFYGILNTSKGLAVVAVSAVSDEQGERPPVAMLVTGRLLNGDILQVLSNMLQTNISIMTVTDQYLASDGGLGETSIKALSKELDSANETFHMKRSQGMYVPQYAAHLRDMAGDVVGVVQTQSPSVSATQAVDDQLTLMIYVVAVLAVLVILVILLLRRRIVVPLRHFTSSLQEVAAGKQIDHIPKHVMEAEAAIVQAVQQITRWNQMLEKTVQRRTTEIRNLLDHAHQGFLSFGADLKVKDEYSVDCLRLFGRDPAGHEIDDLLYPEDTEEKALLRSILSDYFQENSESAKEVIFSLLPDELRIGSRTVKAEFIPIHSGSGTDGEPESVMAILTDLTETRQLENLMEQERRILRMVVQIVTHPEDYAHILRDFESFNTSEIAESLAGTDSPQEKAAAIYRRIHTFKGSFAFLHFVHIVSKLHQLESGLQEHLKDPHLSLAALTDFLREQNLGGMLDDDLQVLRTVLGPSYNALLLEEGVVLDRSQWDQIEAALSRTLTAAEDRNWMEKFHTWRYRPVRSLFKPYAVYLTELAERNGVLLKPVELLGGDIAVDPDRMYGFARSFVHVVRNAVVHGIEPPEERVAQGKDEFGTISFLVEEEEDGVRIVFGDDGRGIDPEAVKEKAASRGLNTEHLTDDEALRLIFEEQMSTSEQVSEWSGRGVGLSVVREETERLGGTIQIRSEKGVGTSFEFRIPHGATRGEDRIGV